MIKRERTFEIFKNCLEATQVDSKINYFEKNEINIDSFLLLQKKA